MLPFLENGDFVLRVVRMNLFFTLYQRTKQIRLRELKNCFGFRISDWLWLYQTNGSDPVGLAQQISRREVLQHVLHTLTGKLFNGNPAHLSFKK
jgi:hypothetical protein